MAGGEHQEHEQEVGHDAQGAGRPRAPPKATTVISRLSASAAAAGELVQPEVGRGGRELVQE